MIGDAVIFYARNLLYIRERTGNNDHPVIDQMLVYLGLPKHLSWCLAFCLWCWHGAVNPLPFPKIARCSTFWEQTQDQEWKYKTFDLEDVAWGIEKARAGDIMIFSHAKVAGKNNWNGHAALVRGQISSRSFATIEGNTSSGNAGSQREGNGVFERIRSPKQGNMALEGFVRSRRYL
jgi:hypothetical protein